MVHCVGNMTKICKTMNLKTCTSAYLRSMTNLVKLFLTTGMPVLEVNLKFQVSEVEKIVKGIQSEFTFSFIIYLLLKFQM